jgi:cytoskeleton protein RodZ
MMSKALRFYNKPQEGQDVEINSTTDIADLLKKVREQNGLTIAEVSDHIKIRGEHLNFIENDQFTKLPGKVYAVGFVRTYANYLGLDENFIVEKMRVLPEFTEALAIIKSPKIERNSNGVPLSVVMFSGFLLVLFFIVFSYFSDSRKTIQESVQTESISSEEKKEITFQ